MPSETDTLRKAQDITIVPARRQDIDAIVLLDEDITGTDKADDWQRLHDAAQAEPDRVVFLVAWHQGSMVGFIGGEISAWEFGSEPCGWIHAIAVHPEARLDGIGTALFEAICDRFRQAGVARLRVMVERDAQLLMSFFRGHGMMAGRFVELEKGLDA